MQYDILILFSIILFFSTIFNAIYMLFYLQKNFIKLKKLNFLYYQQRNMDLKRERRRRKRESAGGKMSQLIHIKKKNEHT